MESGIRKNRGESYTKKSKYEKCRILLIFGNVASHRKCRTLSAFFALHSVGAKKAVQGTRPLNGFHQKNQALPETDKL